MKLCATLHTIDKVSTEILNSIGDGVVILQGDLAAGKTTLVKSIAQHLGVTEAVTSPTFSLQQCYASDLFHYDIYNEGFEKFISLGLLEELEKPGLHLIEWGNNQLVDLLVSAGFSVMKVVIEKREQERCYIIEEVA